MASDSSHDFSDWTEDELLARIEELEPLVEELEALLLMQDIEYLVAEGFVVESNGQFYFKEDAHDLEV